MKPQRPKKPDVNETAFAVVMAAIGERPQSSAAPPPEVAPKDQPAPAPKKPRKNPA